MSLKVERRGKYAGVKVHLEADACQLLIDLVKKATPKLFEQASELAVSIGEKIVKLQKQYPNLLKDRTEAEIKHELEVELKSAQEKLKAIKSGEDWKGIHIK